MNGKILLTFVLTNKVKCFKRKYIPSVDEVINIDNNKYCVIAIFLVNVWKKQYDSI